MAQWRRLMWQCGGENTRLVLQPRSSNDFGKVQCVELCRLTFRGLEVSLPQESIEITIVVEHGRTNDKLNIWGIIGTTNLDLYIMTIIRHVLWHWEITHFYLIFPAVNLH